MDRLPACLFTTSNKRVHSRETVLSECGFWGFTGSNSHIPITPASFDLRATSSGMRAKTPSIMGYIGPATGSRLAMYLRIVRPRSHKTTVNSVINNKLSATEPETEPRGHNRP